MLLMTVLNPTFTTTDCIARMHITLEHTSTFVVCTIVAVPQGYVQIGHVHIKMLFYVSRRLKLCFQTDNFIDESKYRPPEVAH